MKEKIFSIITKMEIEICYDVFYDPKKGLVSREIWRKKTEAKYRRDNRQLMQFSYQTMFFAFRRKNTEWRLIWERSLVTGPNMIG